MPVRITLTLLLAVGRIAKASMGGLKDAYMKKDTGAIFKEPSSFFVQTSISGSGEVIAVACPILISFMGIFLSVPFFKIVCLDFS